MCTEVYRIACPAKTNLALELTAHLEDGYHELDTIFVWLGLSDELELIPNQERSSLEMVDQSNSALEISVGEDNLVLRALRLLEADAGRSLPTSIRLVKKIPAGGGLGGGSGNASGLLYALNQIYKLGYSVQQLEQIGAQLGADVAFGIRGGLARGRGRGNLLEPLKGKIEQQVIVACPPVGCPTPEIYRLWDQQPYRQSPGSAARMVHRFEQPDDSATDCWSDWICNDLTQAAYRYAPSLAEVARSLESIGCSKVFLSGSGSTLIGLASQGTCFELGSSPDLLEGVTYIASALCSQSRPEWADLSRVAQSTPQTRSEVHS